MGKLQDDWGVVPEGGEDSPAERRILDVRMLPADSVEEYFPALIDQRVNGTHGRLRRQGVTCYAPQFHSILVVSVVCMVEEGVDMVRYYAEVQQQICGVLVRFGGVHHLLRDLEFLGSLYEQ